MNKPLVSIIIINWNGKEVFKDCLASLEKLDYSNWELIVVDNGSQDGSTNLVDSYKLTAKNYVLIQNQENVGFAQGNNQGFEKTSGDYILLLNNDTKITPDFLKIMVEKMEKEEKVLAMQPKIYLMDMPGYLDNCGAFLTWTGFLQHWGFMQKDSIDFDKEREVFTAKGACLLIKRQAIEKVGLFDKDFGSYFEETDFCWRIWLIGGKVLYYPKANIFHKLGATSKKMDQINVNFNSFKNRIMSLFKNLSLIGLITILIPHLGIVFLLGCYYIVKFEFKKSWMVFSSILWNIFYLPKSLIKRMKVQKLRRKTDNEIFKTNMVKTNIFEMLSHFKKVEANFK